MNSFALRFFVFASLITALCSSTIVSAQEHKKRYNLFDGTVNGSPFQRNAQQDSSSKTDAISQSFKKAFNPETEQHVNALLYFCVCVIGLSIIIGGLVYWQVLRRKQMEKELKEPRYLVQELYYVHQLSDIEKRFIQELSDRNALPSPLTLFVEPKFLLEAWEGDSYVSARRTVRRLLSKLFDITVEGVGEGSSIVGKVDSETKLFSPGTQA